MEQKTEKMSERYERPLVEYFNIDTDCVICTSFESLKQGSTDGWLD